jgi:hypothetical protein
VYTARLACGASAAPQVLVLSLAPGLAVVGMLAFPGPAGVRGQHRRPSPTQAAASSHAQSGRAGGHSCSACFPGLISPELFTAAFVGSPSPPGLSDEERSTYEQMLDFLATQVRTG